MESIILSCRQEGDSTTQFIQAPGGWINWSLCPLEEGQHHHSKRLSTLGGALAPIIKDGARVLILVHGFNSDIETVEGSYSEIIFCVGRDSKPRREYDAVIGLAWPGSWSGTVGFGFAMRRTQEVARRLRLVFDWLLARQCKVDVMGHSMGCRVILQAIPGYQESLGKIDLTGAAVPCTALKGLRGPGLFVWHSADDEVLTGAYRMWPGNWFTPALGCVGPRDAPKGVTAVDLSMTVPHHGDYRHSASFWDLWHAIG
jgi:pimeloyl-ACP methyl ester carboxylesterase